MARKSYTSVVIVLVVLVVIALVVRYVGRSLWQSLASMHGGGH